MRTVSILMLVVILAAIGGTIWWLERDPGVGSAAGAALLHQVPVTLPTLSAAALAGGEVFGQNCAVCHGVNAAGGPGGPPLVHVIYEPNHHGDGSFVAAVRRGVRQHHWNFGNMPPVDGVSDQQLKQTISYVRELQRANGIN